MWPEQTALTLAILSVASGLCVVGWLAVRGITETMPRRIVLLVGVAAVAASAIGIQILAHG